MTRKIRLTFKPFPRKVIVSSRTSTTAGERPAEPHGLPTAPAELFTPEDKQVLDNNLATYRFSWATVENAVKYHLEISTSNKSSRRLGAPGRASSTLPVLNASRSLSTA